MIIESSLLLSAGSPPFPHPLTEIATDTVSPVGTVGPDTLTAKNSCFRFKFNPPV